jgi:hypothetical protein
MKIFLAQIGIGDYNHDEIKDSQIEVLYAL